MTALAPRWAFNAQAIDAAGDPHLANGVHLRAIPSMTLGLPVAPFIVSRRLLGTGGNRVGVKSDVTWIDSLGVPRSLPFDVKPDNPVTGWLPPPSSGICCWLRVEATPLKRNGLRVDGVVGTPRGDAVVASQNRPAYDLAASRIERVVVSGSGQVTGVSYVDARAVVSSATFFRSMGLPVPAGDRYAPLANAGSLALDRVRRGAPKRVGLHDAPTSLSPASAPAATVAQEEARVNELRPPVDGLLDQLVDDLSLPPFLLSRIEAVTDGLTGDPLGEFGVNALGAVFQASLDPGLGRWLGFVDVDSQPPSTLAGEVIAYVVRGFWLLDEARIGPFLPTIPSAAIIPNETALAQILRTIPGFKTMPSITGRFLDLVTVACVTLGNPGLRPSPPVLAEPRNGPWMPIELPEMQREIVIPASGMPPGAVVALARLLNGDTVSLNPRTATGRALPMVPAVQDNAATAGAGEFADRTAPPEAPRYRAAQADWFGRWSEWIERNASAGIFVPPPRPALNVVYRQPAFTTQTGPLAGTVVVRAAMPPRPDLPPGSQSPRDLEVSVNGQNFSFSIGAAPPPEVEVTRPGPPLQRGETRIIPIVARWVTVDGLRSADSETAFLEMSDPRPPAPLAIASGLPGSLVYAARPDATGRARVQVNWTATTTQKRFRVFYTDENRLVGALTQVSGGATVANALAQAAEPGQRAFIFEQNRAMFGRHLFEQLTGQPLESPINNVVTSAPMSFEHDVSGSLGVLSFYRIVPVSGVNVEAAFESSPLVPVAVPNSGPPNQPQLAVQPLFDPDRAQMTIQVPRGRVPAAEYRLRRTTSEALDILRMPIAMTGTVPPPAVGPDGPAAQEVTIVDLGALQVRPTESLQPWTTYTWRVEVRGAPEPGNGPPGEWSRPSGAVSTTLIPADPPRPPSAPTLVPSGAGFDVQWQHPDSLVGGTMGSYRLDLYRRLPGAPEVVLVSVSADAPPAAGGRNPNRTGSFHVLEAGPVPPGTSYRIVVVDPLERASRPGQPAVVGG